MHQSHSTARIKKCEIKNNYNYIRLLSACQKLSYSHIADTCPPRGVANLVQVDLSPAEQKHHLNLEKNK